MINTSLSIMNDQYNYMYTLFSYRFIKIFAGRSFEHLSVMLKEYQGVESKCIWLKNGLDELCLTVGMCATSSSFLLFLLENPWK